MVFADYLNNTVDTFDYFQLNLSNVEDVEDYKRNNNEIKLHCIVLSLFYFMSKTSEICTNYNVDSNTKFSNYTELRTKCLN